MPDLHAMIRVEITAKAHNPWLSDRAAYVLDNGAMAMLPKVTTETLPSDAARELWGDVKKSLIGLMSIAPGLADYLLIADPRAGIDAVYGMTELVLNADVDLANGTTPASTASNEPSMPGLGPFPADYYQGKYGLLPNTLNQARRRGALPAEWRGTRNAAGERKRGRWFYLLSDVRKLFPDPFTDDTK